MRSTARDPSSRTRRWRNEIGGPALAGAIWPNRRMDINRVDGGYEDGLNQPRGAGCRTFNLVDGGL